MTAVKNVTERRTTPSGQSCLGWLEFISGPDGPTHLVLAAMLADAACECLQLTRGFDCEAGEFWCFAAIQSPPPPSPAHSAAQPQRSPYDFEDTDPALLHSRIAEFKTNVNALFIDGKCVQVGLTQRMLKSVGKQRLWFNKHTPRIIGKDFGLDNVGLNTCLQRMAGWATLSLSVVNSEFPQFETARAFRVFALGRSQTTNLGGGVNLDADFKQLADTFGVDEAKLKLEFEQVVGIAEYHYNQERISNREAWSKAMAHISKRADSRRRYNIVALDRVLLNYCTWMISTSGVEQNFSIRKNVARGQRGSLAEQRELDELQIKAFSVGKRKNDIEEVSRLAQDAWANLYGKPRLRNAQTQRRRYKRLGKRKCPQVSYANFMRHRTEDVKKLVQNVEIGATHNKNAEMVGKRKSEPIWTESHQKEIERQQQQRRLRWLESAALGCVSVPPALRLLVDEFHRTKDKFRASRGALEKNWEIWRRAQHTTLMVYEFMWLLLLCPEPSSWL